MSFAHEYDSDYALYPESANSPASASRSQLELFDRILQNRITQLNKLPLSHLEIIYGNLTASDQLNSTELWTCLSQAVPDMSPQDKFDYISLVRSLLTTHFHKSIDTRNDAKSRQHAVNCCKELLDMLDEVHMMWIQSQQMQGSERMEV